MIETTGTTSATSGQLIWRKLDDWPGLRAVVNETAITIYRTFQVDRHLGVCYVVIRDGLQDSDRLYFDDFFKALDHCIEWIISRGDDDPPPPDYDVDHEDPEWEYGDSPDLYP